jgi:glycosyltransferase involved in cell wall biosynthesis
MRIGIDVTASIYQGTGVASYYRELVPQLLKLGGKHEFVLLGYALRRFQELTLATKRFRFPPRVMEFLWNQMHIFPVEKLVGEVDVFHAWDYLQPPAKKAKIVTTIHDLTAIKFPMYHHPLTVAAQTHRLRWVRREASLVIADSKATKKDIVELLGIEAERVRVVYLAAGDVFGKFRIQNSEFRIREIKRIREKYRIEGEYILAVGTMEPRKNLKRVIEAFSKIINHKSNIRNLVIVGRAGWGEQVMPANGVKFLRMVMEEDLPGLYAGASALVYPSLYEGFGLPVLEAMTVDCPVVTSDRGSLKEVAGNAAVLVDPESEESIAMGIEEAMEKRAALVKKGLAQAAKFSWEKAARETLRVYEEAVG